MVAGQDHRDLVLAPCGLIAPDGADQVDRLPADLGDPLVPGGSREAFEVSKASLAEAGQPLVEGGGAYPEVAAGESGVGALVVEVYPLHAEPGFPGEILREHLLQFPLIGQPRVVDTCRTNTAFHLGTSLLAPFVQQKQV